MLRNSMIVVSDSARRTAAGRIEVNRALAADRHAQQLSVMSPSPSVTSPMMAISIGPSGSSSDESLVSLRRSLMVRIRQRVAESVAI